MPSASLREFFRIWDWLENKQTLEMGSIGNAINTWNINELVRDALISRYHVIQASRLFLDKGNSVGLRFEEIVKQKHKGVAMIINMSKVTPVVRRMIVELGTK